MGMRNMRLGKSARVLAALAALLWAIPNGVMVYEAAAETSVPARLPEGAAWPVVIIYIVMNLLAWGFVIGRQRTMESFLCSLVTGVVMLAILLSPFPDTSGRTAHEVNLISTIITAAIFFVATGGLLIMQAFFRPARVVQ